MFFGNDHLKSVFCKRRPPAGGFNSSKGFVRLQMVGATQSEQMSFAQLSIATFPG